MFRTLPVSVTCMLSSMGRSVNDTLELKKRLGGLLLGCSILLCWLLAGQDCLWCLYLLVSFCVAARATRHTARESRQVFLLKAGDQRVFFSRGRKFNCTVLISRAEHAACEKKSQSYFCTISMGGYAWSWLWRFKDVASDWLRVEAATVPHLLRGVERRRKWLCLSVTSSGGFMKMMTEVMGMCGDTL